jgi:hypothetical protein
MKSPNGGTRKPDTLAHQKVCALFIPTLRIAASNTPLKCYDVMVFDTTPRSPGDHLREY